MICHNCGSENREQAKFCVRCGAKMKQQITSAAETPQSQSIPVKEIVVGSFLEQDFSEKVETNQPAQRNETHPKHTHEHAASAAKAELEQVIAQLQQPKCADNLNKSKSENHAEKAQQKSSSPAPQDVDATQAKQALPLADKKLTGSCVRCGSAISQAAVFCMRCGARQPESGAAGEPLQPVLVAETPKQQNAPLPAEAAAAPRAKEQETPFAGAGFVNPTASVPTEAKQKPAKEHKTVKPTKQKPPKPAANRKMPKPAGLCAVCQTPISRKTVYCIKCGAPASKAVVSRKKSKKALVGVAVVAAAVILIVGGTLGFSTYRSAQYQGAIGNMAVGNYDAAYRSFRSLGNFELAKTYSDYCEAQVLFGAGQYGQAKTLFSGVQGYGDAAAMAQLCQHYMDYADAAQLLAQGKHYEAFVAYDALGDFLDSAALKLSCVMETPKSGTVYRNSNYEDAEVTIRIHNQSFRDAYLKIYDGDILVASVFIRSEDMAVVSFKSGNYSMNKAMGLHWFGEDDLFGDDGYYAKVLFDEQDADHYQFDAGSEGTLTIAAGGDAGVENKDIDRKAC